MRIRLVAPATSTTVSGNGVTAARWRRILADLGHDVELVTPDAPEPDEVGADGAEPGGAPAELLVALHARRSADAVAASRQRHPDRPIVLALTGTDLYEDLTRSATARRSVALADRLVVLQPRAREALPTGVRDRVVVVPQSLPPPAQPGTRPSDRFTAVLGAHLRAVKDPLLAPRAVRLLPRRSKVQLVHFGAPLDEELADAARRESADNPRYTWEGEVSRDEMLRVVARAHALVLTSRLEGGANVVSEAIVCGVPVLATRVEGTVGMLGEDYPGLFPVGDAPALADLLQRAEDNRDGLFDDLERRIRALQPGYRPERERDAWVQLLATLP